MDLYVFIKDLRFDELVYKAAKGEAIVTGTC